MGNLIKKVSFSLDDWLIAKSPNLYEYSALPFITNYGRELLVNHYVAKYNNDKDLLNKELSKLNIKRFVRFSFFSIIYWSSIIWNLFNINAPKIALLVTFAILAIAYVITFFQSYVFDSLNLAKNIHFRIGFKEKIVNAQEKVETVIEEHPYAVSLRQILLFEYFMHITNPSNRAYVNFAGLICKPQKTTIDIIIDKLNEKYKLKKGKSTFRGYLANGNKKNINGFNFLQISISSKRNKVMLEEVIEIFSDLDQMNAKSHLEDFFHFNESKMKK